MAADPIIYCLENVTDYVQFERFCDDVMALEGFQGIEPLGGSKDKGRDAVHTNRNGEKSTVFAYSVREDWKIKLMEDAKKIHAHKHPCNTLVFLTTATFSSGERDAAIESILKEFGWHLELYGIERLRTLISGPYSKLIAQHPQIFTPDFVRAFSNGITAFSANNAPNGILTLNDAVIGIITALPKELAAVLMAFECETTPIASPRPGVGTFYRLARVKSEFGGEHIVSISTLVNIGNNMSAIVAANMISDCPNLKQIIMVGIAGAVPSPTDSEHHVRLGDIVVSDLHGVVQFDLGKDDEIKGYSYRGTSTRPSATLMAAIRYLQAQAELGNRPWEIRISSLTEKYGEWKRPIETSDVLIDAADEIPHPTDSERRPGSPKVILGPIASSNILLKNAAYRNQLRDQYKVKAVEMEGAGIADATWLASCGYLVVRGTCDYCNSRKNDIWHRYSAMIAACYARAIVEFTPPLVSARTTVTMVCSPDLNGQLATLSRQVTQLTAAIQDANRSQQPLKTSVGNITGEILSVGEDSKSGSGLSGTPEAAVAMQSRVDTVIADVPDGIPTSTTPVQAKELPPEPTSLAAQALRSGTSEPTTSTPDIELVVEKSYEFLSKVKSALQVAEIDKSLKIGRDLEQWLPSHEHLLPEQVVGELFLALANLAVIQARVDAAPGITPDMSKASRYLLRARNVRK